MRVEYREEPCKAALNRVKGMMFDWSLNPYMGCVHRCTFCYVRAFELRADRPFDERYGRSIRVKTNVVEVLRRELSRASWEHESVAIGAATDPYQPAEGRYRLTRGCIEALRDHSNPFSVITRGPRPGTREHFLEALACDFPAQLPAYEQLYARRAYLGAAEAKPLRAQVAELARRHNVRDRRPSPIRPEPEPEQLALAL